MKFSAPAFVRTTLGAIALTLGASAMAQTQTLRIQDYPGLGNMIVRVAAANGYCEKNGLKCELKTIPAGPLGIQTLMAGDIDVAFGPSEVVIQAANKGADLKIIGTITSLCQLTRILDHQTIADNSPKTLGFDSCEAAILEFIGKLVIF